MERWPMPRNIAAVVWSVGDWRGSRSGGYGRNPWGAGATESAAGTHRAKWSSASVHCCEKSLANERCLDRWPRRSGDGWRWRHGGCNGRDTGAHTRGRRRVAWSGLTLRAMAIAATVIRDGSAMSATGALIDMTAECGGATARNGEQDLCRKRARWFSGMPCWNWGYSPS